jgi:diguanylate cyclase (GGDEF)-like protein
VGQLRFLHRLRVDPAAGSGRGDWAPRSAMGPALMYVFAAGGTLILLSLSLSGASPDSGVSLWLTAACAYAAALTLLVGHHLLPEWSFPVLLACATMLVEWAIFASGDDSSAFAMFYFWLAIYAFMFFPPIVGMGELGLICLSYAAVLAIRQDLGSPAVLRWIITTASLTVAGAMIGFLRRRVTVLVGDLRQVASVDLDSGMLNRVAFEQTLERELLVAKRTQTPLSVIVGDLRGLEELRRRRGPVLAQGALRAASAAFREQLRPTDSLARIGESTVAVVAPFSGDHVAYVLAERMLDGLRTAGDTAAADLGLRFGIASFPSDARAADELLDAASRALAAAGNDTAAPIARLADPASPDRFVGAVSG